MSRPLVLHGSVVGAWSWDGVAATGHLPQLASPELLAEHVLTLLA